jgi:gliding motility-associated-like protein
MRAFCLIIIHSCLFVFSSSRAQNLVPNESFESYNSCPASLLSIPYSTNYGNFPTVVNWANPAKLSSPDYMHTCAAASTGLQVPNTTFGYQQPHTGNAYGGIIAFQGQYTGSTLSYDYREYLQIKLSQPMIAGRRYCVSFFVSPTISSAFNYNYVAIDEVGINFSDVRMVDTINYTMSLPYDVKSTAGIYIGDTSKWHEITGTYLASGGETWLTIGCFKNNNSAPSFINVYPVNPTQGSLYWSYLFIDDVSVKELTAADTIRQAHDTLVCKTSGLSIDFNGAGGALSWLWNNGSTASTLNVSDTGKYWCAARMPCGLIVDTFKVKYQPYKPLNLGKDTINCMAQPVALHANYPYATYLWSTGATGNSITASQSGTYILTVTDTCGIQRDTIAVTIQSPTPPPLVSDTTICQSSIAPTLVVTGINLKWYYPNSILGLPVQPYISTTQYGIQTLYVTQTIGKCESPKAALNVKVKHTPIADVGDYISICKDTDTLIGREYPDVNYLWSTNEQVCCIKPRGTGTYQVTISNSCGTSSDTIFVEMSACDDCIFMPTAFTPNNDGRNDVISPVFKCPVDQYRLQIFDRWGALMFSSEDPGSSWDGKNNGNPAGLGTYAFVLEYRSVNTVRRKYQKGNITLIR